MRLKYLCDALCGHVGLVIKNAAEMVSIRKHIRLSWKVGSTGVY